MTDVLMPALSPTMEEGTLAKWHVKVGDTVKSGDVIAEIETDKATMEVEAVDEGVVEELLVPEGTEEVKVNTPIARLKGEGELPSPSRGGAGGGGPTLRHPNLCRQSPRRQLSPNRRWPSNLSRQPNNALRVPHPRPLPSRGRGECSPAPSHGVSPRTLGLISER
jgi:pyruvate/2-oxoglutarate dehydrogenase complex dihydrolipoamide acyltransferase (E2) component